MKRGLVWMAAVTTVLAWAGPSQAASPGSVTVAPSSSSAGWAGKSFLLGKTASPALCPAAADPLNLLCDHETVVSDVSSSYWDAHSGSLRISIGWASSSDDFDLYVYDSSGHLMGSSAAKGSTGEAVTVSSPAGSYEARVVPVSVTSSGYSGTATFSSQALPSPDPGPTPKPSPSPSPGGGNGGGGSGGGGNGGGGGGGGGGNGGGSNGGSGSGQGSGPGHRYFGPGSPFFYGPSAPYYYHPAFGSGRQIFVPGSETRTELSSQTHTRTVPGSRTNTGGFGSSQTRVAPVSAVVPRSSEILWALLPFALLLLALIGLAAFEPATDVSARSVLTVFRRRRAEVPGGIVRGTAAGARRLASAGRPRVKGLGALASRVRPSGRRRPGSD